VVQIALTVMNGRLDRECTEGRRKVIGELIEA